MVGAGIFALLGEAGAISGSAVYLSFIIGGLIALLSAYSMGKLGARYPSAGGIVEYLSQAYGVGFFTGAMSIVLYFSAVVSISLIAKAFGNYAATFLPSGASSLGAQGFAIFIVLVLWETLTVAIKFSVLCVLSIAGIFFLDLHLLSPSTYPPTQNIFFSVAITFFGFEGFRVITNTAEDMPNPAKTLPRAMITSVLLVMVLYVAVSFAVFGNLSLDKIDAAKDFALAEAAVPIFGQWGFIAVTLTALIATASAINASLYAVTNVTYQLAKDGELPAVFGRPIAHSREGLLISGGLIIGLSLLFDLSQIAAIGSISVLFVHMITHLGHLKLLKKTRASALLVSLAAFFCLVAIVLALIYTSQKSSSTLYILILIPLGAAALAFTLQKLTKRQVKPRLP
jgi:amino acid transporter